MTVGTLPPRAEYVENGVTTLHAVPFQFFDPDELIVTRIKGTRDSDEILLTLNVDYTVAGGNGDVGSITKTTGGINGATLRIDRYTHRSQLLDYEPGDEFPAEMHEEGLDRLEMQIQEIELRVLSEEMIRDLLAKILKAGPGIKIEVDDDANTITISATAIADFLADLPDFVMLSGDQQTWNGSTGESSGGLTAEDVQDIVAAMIVDGANMSHAYDDALGKLTITSTGGGGGTGLTTENVQDIVGAMIVGSGLGVSYNDTTGQLTITDTDAGGGGGELTVDSSSLTGNGYLKLSNGLILQWGSVNVAANSTPKVYYPVACTTFSVAVGSGGHNGTSNPNNCRIVACAVDGFNVCNNDPAAATFFWHAIGK
jgi:hypothetical protein